MVRIFHVEVEEVQHTNDIKDKIQLMSVVTPREEGPTSQ